MHLPSSQQMQVKMIHGLSPIRTGVDHDAETIVEVLQLSDFISGEKEFAEQFGFSRRGMCERSEVSLGDDQDMHRRLWIDVRERQHVIVFKQTRDGNGARGNLAEETVRSGSHVRMLNLRDYFLKYFGSIPGIHGL